MSQKNVKLACQKAPYLSCLYEQITVFAFTISCREGKDIGTRIYDQDGIYSVIYGV